MVKDSTAKIKIQSNAKYTETLISNEFLLSTLFMLGLINAFTSGNLQYFNIKSPTELVYASLFLTAVMAYVRAFVTRFSYTVITIFTALIALFVSVLLNAEIIDQVFNYGRESFSAIAQSNFNILFGLCIPLMLFCVQDLDVKKLYSILLKYSYALVSLFVMLMIMKIFRYPKGDLAYMTVAYSVLPGAFFMLYDSMSRKRTISTVMLCASIVGLFIGGCRGALLTMIVLTALWRMRSLRNLSTVRKLIILALSFLLALLFLYFADSIVAKTDLFLKSMGYSSRILSKLSSKTADNGILSMKDRTFLYDIIKDNIGFIGKGLYADRILLPKGQYAHNIILEILLQFGYSLGIPIIIAFITFLVKSYKAARKIEITTQNDFYVFCWYCFFAITFVKMMVSSSYLSDQTFWMYLSLNILCFNKGKLEKNV